MADDVQGVPPETPTYRDPVIVLHANGRGHFYAMLQLTKECLSSEWQGSPEAALVLLVEKMRSQYELWASTSMRLLDPEEVRDQAWLGRFVGGKGMSREPRAKCSPLTARWCPNCGRCTCPQDNMDDPDCPLHASGSDHAEANNVMRGQERMQV